MVNAMSHILRRAFAGMLALVALFLAACSSGDPRESDALNPGDEKYGYISFRLDAEGDVGMDSGMNGLRSGDERDYRVDEVCMVLYGRDDKVHYAFNFSIESDSEGFTEGSGVDPEYGHDLYASEDIAGFVTFARKVVKEEYKMLIIVNGAADIYDITKVGEPLDLLYEPVRRDKEHLFTGGPNGSIMMTNYQDLIPVKAEQLQGSIGQANEHPIPARVERYLAKIMVTASGDEGKIELRGDMARGEVSTSGMEWAVDCSNKRFYWMRRMAPMIQKDGTKGARETVNYDPAIPIPRDVRLRTYALDPNFEGLSIAKGGTTNERVEQFNYLIYDADFSELSLHNSFGESEYVLENTMDADEQYDEVMTKAVIRLEMTPDKSIVNIGDSYFTFPDNATSKDVIITTHAMRSYLNNASNIPSNLNPGLETAITDILADGSADLKSAASGNDIPGFDLNGLKFYYRCRHYFMVPIRHYDDYDGSSTPGMEYGRYGVVRNNIYNVKIRSVSEPGSPTVSTPTYLAAEVGITPWLKHSQEEDLGSGVEELGTYVTYNYYFEADNGSQIFLGTRYLRSVAVGTSIQTDSWLNTMKSELSSPSTYGDGELLSPAPAKAGADPTENVVEIIYRPSSGGFMVYYIEWNVGIFPGTSISFMPLLDGPEQHDIGSVSISQLIKSQNGCQFANLAATGLMDEDDVLFDTEITDFDTPIPRAPGQTVILILCYEQS